MTQSYNWNIQWNNQLCRYNRFSYVIFFISNASNLNYLPGTADLSTGRMNPRFAGRVGSRFEDLKVGSDQHFGFI